ncbi:MAG: RNA methyltransferase [Lachnospiraceae bacterium]|nr:RNA methyltransferase [Lachnospiraceae bacterium]
MITAASNLKVKEAAALNAKAKARQESGLFVVEGRRLVEELPAEYLVHAYATARFAESEEGAALCRKLGAETVSEAVMEKMSDTRSPQGILAVARQLPGTERFHDGPLLLLERVQDPGNVGTLFRTAEAAGAAGILLDGESADPYSPKVVRGTMGAIFRLPFRICPDIREAVMGLKDDGYRIYAAHLAGSVPYDAPAYPANSVFLLGNEGNGLSGEITALADERIRIPLCGQAESLNVAVAGAVLLYEHLRQKNSRS